MKTYIEHIEHGVQVRIWDDDKHMKIHDSLVYALDNAPDVRMIKKAITFETPISTYEYKGIQFSVMFDEMCDETFVFVGKEYDYTVIEKLMHELI
jgi:hypothetical protein